jgi:hypothetical protein
MELDKRPSRFDEESLGRVPQFVAARLYQARGLMLLTTNRSESKDNLERAAGLEPTILRR